MEPTSSNTTAPLASANSETTSPLLGSSNRTVTPLSGTCSSITAPLFGSSSSITTDLPGSGTTTSTTASRSGTGARTTASFYLWLQQQQLGSSLGLGRQKQCDSPALRWYWRQYGGSDPWRSRGNCSRRSRRVRLEQNTAGLQWELTGNLAMD
ncbi:hypothetical protein F442_12581 [Phytophthora nicotianae P10297]|uniref:Uncharacterized protein n=1 Tax=Phytophthora nicotianae P10297 TaxID=1317064 RepID=W2YZ90_PHYNI|nr:hypothetical protein F442_12581 [Phytophthora nicotianae P10297]